MKVTKAIIILLLFNLTLISGFSQKNLISGKLTGKASAAIKEIQLFFDGSTHRFKPDTVDFIFQAEIELKEPQFVELRSGSGTSEYIYMPSAVGTNQKSSCSSWYKLSANLGRFPEPTTHSCFTMKGG